MNFLSVRGNLTLKIKSLCFACEDECEIFVKDIHLQKRNFLIVDGRDHTACCRRLEIPTVCLGICAGRTLSDPISGILCLAFTEQLLTCFHEGQSK